MSVFMNDIQCFRALLRLKNFRPCEGASGRILLHSEPGLGWRITYILAATEDIGLVYEVQEPPSEETLEHLYLESQRIVETAWNQPAVSGINRVNEARFNLTEMILGMKGAGYDS